LSNHNRLRDFLMRQGERFQTENDSEVAAAYLTWRRREDDSLEAALQHCLEELDGFYTFVVGTREGFAVLRDPIACKPALLAETDDWVTFGMEFRALATLPGVVNARIWEPELATVYIWSRGVHGPPPRPGRTPRSPRRRRAHIRVRTCSHGGDRRQSAAACSEPGRFSHQKPARPPCHCRGARWRAHGLHRRPRGLLLRRHEQESLHHDQR